MSAMKDVLTVVAQELVRLQPNGLLDTKEKRRDVFINFVTVASGAQVHFSRKAIEEIQNIARLLYTNQTCIEQEIRFEEFCGHVRKGVAECFSAGRLVDEAGVLLPDAKKSLRSVVLDAVSSIQIELTHYLPAWTMGIEEIAAFEVGPVRFFTRRQWIDSINFSEAIKSRYGLGRIDWKNDLLNATQGKADASKLHPLARDVFRAVEDCPSVLAVAIAPCDAVLSRQRARMAARAALDSLALIFHNPEMHRRFILHDEPALPMSYYMLSGTSGKLWHPDGNKVPRGAYNSPSDAMAVIDKYDDLIKACGSAISATLTPIDHPAPDLAKRWVTALRWHSDGCRETDDSIAVVKHAACLDILACGRKAEGIIALVESQLGVEGEQFLFERPGLTVNQAVRELYNKGRSRVLHGSFADPMKSFTEQRSRATKLARILLRTTVRNWEIYTGRDVPEWFRTSGITS